MSTANLLTPPPPTRDSSRLELQLKLLPASSRAEAMYLWRKLEVELSNTRLACSSLWTDTWLNHFGSVVPHQYALGMRGAEVCAIALVTQGVQQSAGPFTLKTRHLGTAGEPETDSVFVEYNSILAGPNDHADFGKAIWKWVQHETDCDEFRMDGFDAPFVEPYLAQHSQALIERRISYYFNLKVPRETGEEPMARLGSHTRGNIRRTLRDMGDARGEWAETTTRAEELFHQLMNLHQDRWKSVGRPGVYSSNRFVEFHLELLHRAIPLGSMTIFAVMAGGQLVGCCQGLIDNNRVLLYQCGRAQSKGRVSYGLALDYLCICESARRGYDHVDFLAGEGDHKRRLSTDKAELAWLVWRRSNLKNAAIDAMRRIKRATVELGRSIAPVRSSVSRESDTTAESAK